MSQEEKEEQGRAEGGGESKPKHAPVSSKQSSFPGPSPAWGEGFVLQGKHFHQLIKFTTGRVLSEKQMRQRFS